MHEQDISEFKLKRSKNPWQRPKEKEKKLSKEERKTAELYRNVVAILNKITPQKFKILVKQFMGLNIDTSERLEGAVDRIVEKAICEPMYSVAYANLSRCLFSIKVADAEGNDVSFRKLFMNRCQKEFEREKEDEKAFAEKIKQLEGLSEEEKKAKKEKMDEAIAKNKKRMLANIRFIGELFKLRLLTENIMHDCVFKLLRAGDEESLESMCMLLFIIGEDLDSDKAKPRMEQYFDQINRIIAAKKISSRVIFKLRDVIELRQNKWLSRREENFYPKTIDRIHKEAQIEKMLEQRSTGQLPAKNNKHKKVRPGGRDYSKPTSNDGWIATGKGGMSFPIHQNKLRNMAKRANNEEISVGPSGRFGQWGRGNSAGLKNSSQEQDQPQANRFSALSSGGGGGDMPSNRPYDPRRSNSAGSRPSSGGSRGSDKSR
ncbi:eukaryotic translation initiation factor 4 gamma 3-like isoform X3, partial [Paramuricea clavata]